MAQVHAVKENDGLDSLWKISKKYGVSYKELLQLNPSLKDRIPKYWINPGDVIILPTCLETGDLKKASQPCPKKKRVTAIQGPRLRLCQPAIFTVTQYEGNPTESDKQTRIRWFVRDAKTKQDLVGADVLRLLSTGETLELNCVPFDWYKRTIEVGADFDSPPANAMYTGVPASCGIYDWIATIRKAEAAYPSFTGVQMTNAMRLIAGYDDSNFRRMFGGSPAGIRLTPSGPLTSRDIDNLRNWTSHRLTGSGELGVAGDPYGDNIAAGHVLTGLSAGVYRNRKTDLTPSYSLTAGEKMDNLYAVTISGDLGQVAVFVMDNKQKTPYIGSGTDATDAELIGDIDGWLIGAAEPKGGSGKKLSETLLAYYCPCAESGFKNRYPTFRGAAMGALQDEVIRFATNFAYLLMGKLRGVSAPVEPFCKKATDEFRTWLAKK